MREDREGSSNRLRGSKHAREIDLMVPRQTDILTTARYTCTHKSIPQVPNVPDQNDRAGLVGRRKQVRVATGRTTMWDHALRSGGRVEAAPTTGAFLTRRGGGLFKTTPLSGVLFYLYVACEVPRKSATRSTPSYPDTCLHTFCPLRPLAFRAATKFLHLCVCVSAWPFAVWSTVEVYFFHFRVQSSPLGYVWRPRFLFLLASATELIWYLMVPVSMRLTCPINFHSFL